MFFLCVNDHTITYDAIGNPLNYYDGNIFTWQNGRQLVSWEHASGVGYGSLEYDSEGYRTSKTTENGETSYLYSGGSLLRETKTNPTTNTTVYDLYFTYDEAGRPFSISSYGETLYYFYDIYGNVKYLYDAYGNLVAEYTYRDPWGNDVELTCHYFEGFSIAEVNPFLYKGYYYDADLDMYYCGSRYYDWETCRWLNAEPNVFSGEFDEGAGLLAQNVFAYCANNPVIYVDKSGEGIFLAMAIGFGIGAIVSGVAKIIENNKSGRKWYDGLAISMLAGGVGGAISCIPLPGSKWLSAMITGAVGNLATSLILGEIKSLRDLTSAITTGANAGLLGYGASKVLIKGVTKYFGKLSKSAQKAFLKRIGKISNRELTAIRKQVKNGLTPNALNKLVNKYGYDVIVSAFVSSTATVI